MKLSLPAPGSQYEQANEAQTRDRLVTADAQNQKKTGDVVIAKNRLILTAPNGTRYSVTVSNAGALSCTAL